MSTQIDEIRNNFVFIIKITKVLNMKYSCKILKIQLRLNVYVEKDIGKHLRCKTKALQTFIFLKGNKFPIKLSYFRLKGKYYLLWFFDLKPFYLLGIKIIKT